MSKQALTNLLSEVRSCTLCSTVLPAGTRPIVQAAPESTILVAGQAPGSKVHASGIPFDDASGNRLREWMGVDRNTFYDPSKVAILPLGFCYPGTGKSGDLPPLPICAETWRQKLLNSLDNIRLTLVIGQYAQAWHLPQTHKTLTETVRNWSSYADDVLPLPHPSPRNNIWLAKNPWFEAELVPVLQRRISAALTARRG